MFTGNDNDNIQNEIPMEIPLKGLGSSLQIGS